MTGELKFRIMEEETHPTFVFSSSAHQQVNLICQF